LIYLQKGVFT
jgi:hypothetical protein